MPIDRIGAVNNIRHGFTASTEAPDNTAIKGRAELHPDEFVFENSACRVRFGSTECLIYSLGTNDKGKRLRKGTKKASERPTRTKRTIDGTPPPKVKEKTPMSANELLPDSVLKTLESHIEDTQLCDLPAAFQTRLWEGERVVSISLSQIGGYTIRAVYDTAVRLRAHKKPMRSVGFAVKPEILEELARSLKL